MTSILTKNPLGSLWHRWDPHLHAPGTLLNDQFGGDWEAYLAKLESSTPRIRALGITDYFCIGTYKEVKARKEAGRLKDVEFVFPNVELRIDTKTKDSKAINLHLLFSPSDPNHVHEIERILEHLEFEHDEKRYRCTRDGLIALGKRHDPSQTNDLAALRIGANQFKTTLAEVRSLFKAERWMRDNALVVVEGKSGDGPSGLQEDDAFAALRLQFERFADGIFSGRDKDRLFWIGKGDLNAEEVEKKYRCLKPCLHGSDAHSVMGAGAPSADRYCWLKGDLTFETLRQVVIEPEDRVWIGPEVPPTVNASEAITELATSQAQWLEKPSMSLSPGLIAIVGARGSGKTALADIIACGGGESAELSGSGSFLKRAAGHLGTATVRLGWGDGSYSPTVRLDSSTPPAQSRVRYLSQHFVDALCSAPSLATDLRSEMERVVFESIEDRMLTSSFDELRECYIAPIRTRRDDLREGMRRTADLIVEEEERILKLPVLKREEEALARQIESDKKALSGLLPKDKATHVERLTALEGLVTQKTSDVEALRRRRKVIDDLGIETRNVRDFSEPARHQAMQRRFAGAEMGETWAEFLMKFQGDVDATIGRTRKDVDAEVVSATEGPVGWQQPNEAASRQWPLNALVKLRDAAKAAVGIDADRQKKYDERQRLLGQREIQLQRLGADIKHSEGAEQRRKELIASRRDAYRQVVATLIEEQDILVKLYGPVQERVQGQPGALGKITFSVRRHVDCRGWARAGEALLDLRNATKFKGYGALQQEADACLLSTWTDGDADSIASAMDKFRSDSAKDLLAAMPSLRDGEKRAWKQRLADWLYSTDHISIHYGIEYEGVAIEHLSPGTRGVVLLLLYLAIDRSDSRPLIIDQPEENLDPNSVFQELVPHFREARKRRQVIVVTHNANLVVNTDADQVIVARSSRIAGSTLPRISYETGALENKSIRGAVCDILEGGERAFLEREQRYRLKWGESLALEPTSDAPEDQEQV